MDNYKIEINLDFVKCDGPIDSDPIKHDNGAFSMTISEQDAISIDRCESAVLETAYPAIREAVSRHSAEMSKKKACEKSCNEERVMANPHSYKVDGEIGRFDFTTHSIFSGGDDQYNTGTDVFKRSSCCKKTGRESRRRQKDGTGKAQVYL